MTRVAMSGGGGFLGWHARAALREAGVDVNLVAVGDRFQADDAAAAVSGVDRLIHVAGVNRGSEEEVRNGNALFAEQVADAACRAETPPRTIVYANSTQVGNGSVYGDAKAGAAMVLAEAARRTGASFVDLHLPNLFGEHGRPFYNAVTATFCHMLAEGRQPEVVEDRSLSLLHAQDAADLLTGRADPTDLARLVTPETVSGLLGRLRDQADVYRRGEIPDVAAKFDRDLFNTYRSYVVASMPIRLQRHADARGSFFEIIRSHGGTAQASFSTTEPGISRGDHFHRRKIERFTVLSGEGTILLRKLFTDEVLEFDVTGEEPVAVDMPTMWAHRIVNTGTRPLYTSFWTDDLFDPSDPDTVAEVV